MTVTLRYQARQPPPNAPSKPSDAHSASDDTLIVYYHHSSSYGRTETWTWTWTWTHCAWRCRECERFSISEFQCEY